MATAKETKLDVEEVKQLATLKPSTVKVITFAVYSKSGSARAPKIKCIHGASDARVAEDGVIELLIDNIPFNSKTFKGKPPAPGKGLLMLYGNTDPLADQARWFATARANGWQIARAELEIEVGYMEAGMVSRQILKEYGRYMHFANLRRLTADLQTSIAEDFARYAEKEMSTVDAERLQDVARNPQYFDRLFEEDKDFSRLTVFATVLLDDPQFPKKMRQVAYVRPEAKIVDIRQGGTDVRLVLPSWMTNVKVRT